MVIDTDTRVELEVWSDIACPWCYVGRRNLAIAIEDLPPGDRPVVRWRAFQLDPSLPEEGLEVGEYFRARMGAERAEQIHRRLEQVGEEVGIEFRFDRRRTVANTMRAHRFVAAAAAHGLAEAMLDELFAANFERGIDIGDAERLRELTRAVAVEPELAEAIADAAERDPAVQGAVERDLEMAMEVGVTGVPCFVADRRIVVPGAVPPPVLAQLVEAAAERRSDDADVE